MESEWEAVLDTMEERIEAHAAVLRGADAASPYEVPKGIGPLPLALAARACVILARQQQLEEEFTLQMEGLRNFFDSRSREIPPVPLFFDASA